LVKLWISNKFRGRVVGSRKIFVYPKPSSTIYNPIELSKRDQLFKIQLSIKYKTLSHKGVLKNEGLVINFNKNLAFYRHRAGKHKGGRRGSRSEEIMKRDSKELVNSKEENLKEIKKENLNKKSVEVKVEKSVERTEKSEEKLEKRKKDKSSEKEKIENEEGKKKIVERREGEKEGKLLSEEKKEINTSNEEKKREVNLKKFLKFYNFTQLWVLEGMVFPSA